MTKPYLLSIRPTSRGLIRSGLRWLLAFVTASLAVSTALGQNGDGPAISMQFTSPSPVTFTSEWDVDVKLQISDADDFANLQVIRNGHDVTRLFHLDRCAAQGCTAEANLSVGRDLDHGWNYFLATVQRRDGAVDSTRLRFFAKAGVTDSTNGSGPPYAVHTAMSATSGMEVDYTPENGNGPHYYPGTRSCTNPGGLTMVVLRRSTLGFKELKCFPSGDNVNLQSFLKDLTESDLILASTASEEPLGRMNLAPIGGTDFTAANASTAYSYSVIGYGQGSHGIATESYNTTSTSAWHGLNGNLINISSDNTPLFGFQSTDPVGFAVVPNGSSSTIFIGNPSTFPTGNGGTPPGQTIPAGFTSTSFTSPALTGTGGGIWILTLDRYTLGMVSSTTFSATLANGLKNNSQTTDIRNYLNGLDNSKIIFITTLLASNITAPAITPENTSNQYLNTLQLVDTFGISPFAFDKVMGNQTSLNIRTSKFSTVGVPQGFTQSCDSIPNNSTTICGRNPSQWYSSALDTQQKETGALQGSFVRNKAFQYSPSNVSPMDVASLGDNPTASDYLGSNLSQAIAEAPTVAWPLNDTQAHKNAYAYLSNELVSLDFYGGHDCLADTRFCHDIRFYYTGTESAQIANGADPLSATPPDFSKDPGFARTDWDDAVRQLRLEKSYLGNVLQYEAWVESMNTDATSNIAVILTNSATQVATDLNRATGQPMSVINASPMAITTDVLTALSGISGAIGVVYKPAGVVSGLLSSAGGILSLVDDAQKTKREPDPYVDQLGDLLARGSKNASDAADKFNTALDVSTATFFNGVYSDWFKLQTIGLMTVNPDAPGWYKTTRSGITGGIAPLLTASARKSFYLQTANQYFGYKLVTPVPAYAPSNPWIPSKYPTVDKLNQAMAGVVGLTYDRLAPYSWDFRDVLPQYDTSARLNIADGNWIYIYVVLRQNQKATWLEPFGTILMGPSSSNDGKGNLNLTRDALYDSGVFPYLGGVRPPK